MWVAKQRILCTLTQSLKDVLNYGLFQPASGGRDGKFLDEERLLREYPQPTGVGVPSLEVLPCPLSDAVPGSWTSPHAPCAVLCLGARRCHTSPVPCYTREPGIATRPPCRAVPGSRASPQASCVMPCHAWEPGVITRPLCRAVPGSLASSHAPPCRAVPGSRVSPHAPRAVPGVVVLGLT